MKSRNMRVPVPWEHPHRDDPEGYPVDGNDSVRLRNRELARLNAGWVDDLSIDETGTLKATLDIPREEDASRLSQIGSFVSPQFGRWKEYDSAITHLALTNHPVNTDQASHFAPQEQLSILDVVYEHPVQMSLANLLDSPHQFGDAEEDVSIMENDQKPDYASLEDKPNDDADCEKHCDRLKHSLMLHGVDVRDEIAKDPEVLHDLLIAVTSHHNEKREEKEKQKKEDSAEDRSLTPGDGETSTDAPIEEESTVVTMSEKDVQTQLSALQVDRRNLAKLNNKLMGEVTQQKRAGYQDRIESLVNSGRCTPQRAESLKGLVGTYQFSEHADGFPELDLRLEILEESREGSAWDNQTQVQQFSVSEEKKGSFFTATGLGGDGIPEEDAEDMVKHQLKLLGRED